jgi:hypothetical protein
MKLIGIMNFCELSVYACLLKHKLTTNFIKGICLAMTTALNLKSIIIPEGKHVYRKILASEIFDPFGAT